jgi:hypothetical protein
MEPDFAFVKHILFPAFIFSCGCSHSFYFFFSYGATAPNGALAYLHETLRFTSVFLILDRR